MAEYNFSIEGSLETDISPDELRKRLVVALVELKENGDYGEELTAITVNEYYSTEMYQVCSECTQQKTEDSPGIFCCTNFSCPLGDPYV